MEFEVMVSHDDMMSADTFKRTLSLALANCKTDKDVFVLLYEGHARECCFSSHRHMPFVFGDALHQEQVTSSWLDKMFAKSRAAIYKIFTFHNPHDHDMVKHSLDMGLDKMIEVFSSFDDDKNNIYKAIDSFWYVNGYIRIETLAEKLAAYWKIMGWDKDDYGIEKNSTPKIFNNKWSGNLFEIELENVGEDVFNPWD